MKKGIFLLLLTVQVFAVDDFEIHVLKQGETLSEILAARGYYPLYGKDQWVQKTLEMNHLTSVQDKKIKKGFPIILPSKERPEAKPTIAETKRIYRKIYKEKIVYKKPRPQGWLSGLISEHQDVFIQFGHNRKAVKLPTTKFNQNEAFGIGLNIRGNNKNRIGKLTYDFDTGLEINSQGTASFEDSPNRNVSMEPSYDVFSKARISTPQLDFQFGPSFRLEEKTRVFEVSDIKIDTRRDRTFWLGFNIFREIRALGTNFETELNYAQKMFQNNLDQEQAFGVSNLSAGARVQLTNNYFVGLELSATQYSDIELQSEQKLGFNFRYLIQ